MNCEEYQELDFQERLKSIGTLVHLFQNDSESFVAMSSMIRSATQNGKLDDVRILPDHREEDKY